MMKMFLLSFKCIHWPARFIELMSRLMLRQRRRSFFTLLSYVIIRMFSFVIKWLMQLEIFLDVSCARSIDVP